VLEGERQDASISYIGTDPLPDTFIDKSQALVEGPPRSGWTIVAEVVQAKCASKYEAAPGAKVAPRPAPPNVVDVRRPGSPGDRRSCCGCIRFLCTRSCVCMRDLRVRRGHRSDHHTPSAADQKRAAGWDATCCLIFLATLSLEYLFFSDNFSLPTLCLTAIATFRLFIR